MHKAKPSVPCAASWINVCSALQMPCGVNREYIRRSLWNRVVDTDTQVAGLWREVADGYWSIDINLMAPAKGGACRQGVILQVSRLSRCKGHFISTAIRGQDGVQSSQGDDKGCPTHPFYSA